MKINKIAAICKKSKQVAIFTDPISDGVQFIGDGYATYSVSGLPELDSKSILTIFDVPECKQEEWAVRSGMIPDYLNFHDTDSGEKIIEISKPSIILNGKELYPFYMSRGITFFNSSYFKPFANMDYIYFFERYTSQGIPYIAVKSGIILCAIIMPMNIINESFVEQVTKLANECKWALERKSNEENRDQSNLYVNPDTGEIIDPDARPDPGSEGEE